MKTILNPAKTAWKTILERPTKTVDDIEKTVLQIFDDVQKNGDAAVDKYTSLFDGVQLNQKLVTTAEIEKAIQTVSSDLKEAIRVAHQNISLFHKVQKTEKVAVETYRGVFCWQEKRPIQKVGLYIPGGTAPLFSTVLMLAIPAQIAGCKEIVLCSPPNKEGNIHPAILYAANLCGVTKIIKVGGIQAIAGLTFGTADIPQVYKIFGPGNQFVTVAKQLATKYGVAIDMPAGPSELLVVADESAKASYVASDLLSQAEHGIDSQVILVSTSKVLIQEVADEISKQIVQLPRKEIAVKAIENSKSIFVETDAIALDLINEYGPEHFIVATKNNAFYVENITNAGSVFIGNYTPESAGDYASGTNHTLPTNGFSKAYSGVNLDSFLKSITFQEISKDGIQRLGKFIEIMAEAEGLQAHKNAVTLRLNDLK
ncbi:MAG: histidinol dehydrogenase [Flavobacteriia bacterium]|nr:histidinol dehydrogenase [Flavobacteriia bacterium]OIP45127.1 MAG: histidinol dehydrogenase [Flavobacteriaceae bacterium CG2_30_31_66]PIV95323.1 MAG: histidinol dehydrogenase [Flavobacteriaceae bacterium CG17_big_fil_post_rev_8_21_14_2_50_31_13]PIX12848.1 MAG: histidinol dehydrogenase [Flavobacteriaceae bacterium CG_4_8_14_3_um_filter_31_8]PIY13654.1 MAG: histidinol dehydrogenase [Flavobacteriaceae bacterium CG_4_10_14_3_um_filter_31_253]PIZ11785.1 MAG: histidinol dehydrogenase [Flavobacter